MPLNIVLMNPEIPQNTGNIARTCAATGAVLHLIEPLGFSLSDKYLRRAGLDYWHLMQYIVYPSADDFFSKNSGANIYYTSKKGAVHYNQVKYHDGDFIMFGRESCGLDEELLKKEYSRCIRIPMREEARSLNLSNSVAVVLYEAMRQLDFPGLSGEGHLGGVDEGNGWKDYV